MTKMMLAPDSSGIVTEWIELDCRIYTGPEDGYTESIHLSEESEPRAGSVACLGYWHEEGHWGFIFKGGHICLINDNSIRYVKARTRGGIESETQSDDVMRVKDGSEQGTGEKVHAPEATPKRRGRPPKVRVDQ